MHRRADRRRRPALNDANVLALSLRRTSRGALTEILDAWFETPPSRELADVANVGHLAQIEVDTPSG